MKEFILILLTVTALSSGAYCTLPDACFVEREDITSSIMICEYANEPVNLKMPGVQYMILK